MASSRPTVLVGDKEIRERAERSRNSFREIMIKYEGFRASSYYGEGFSGGLVPTRCNDRKSPCGYLVLLYTKMGLHHYNLLRGKRSNLIRVKKYNKSVGGGCILSSYYITCRAKDPAPQGSGLVRTFQAVIREERYNRFVLTCCAARILGEPTKVNFSPKKSLITPELPPEDPFKEDDTNRFYVLKESEVQKNNWIRLYLELAVATTNRKSKKIHSLANLKILKVAMESTRDTKGLDAYDAIFYIRYEDSCKARVGKNVDRVAIVRRFLDEEKGTLSLVGRHQSYIKSCAPMEVGSSAGSI